MLLKYGIIVGFGTLLSRVTGYIRDIFIAAFLGTGPTTEAFAIALKLPYFFRNVFAEGAFNAAFVPIFSRKYSNKGKDRAIIFASDALTILMIALFIVTLLMEIFMPSIVGVLAHGFANDVMKFNLTILLSRITFPYLFFISIVTLYIGVLNSIGRFVISPLIPAILNISMILTLIIIPENILQKAESLAFGVLLAGLLQLLIIIYACYKANHKLTLKKPQISEPIKMLFKNMVPAILGSGVVQLNLWVGTMIATQVSGVVSVLYYAERLNQFPLAIIGTAIGTVLLPSLSKYLRDGENEKANDTLNKSFIICLFLTIPCSIMLYFCGDLIISILFQRKAFLSTDTIMVSDTLAVLSLGLPAFVSVKIFTPRYFAALDTKTPVYISICSMLSNLFISYALIHEYKYLGIAIASTASGWINIVLSVVVLLWRKQFYFDKFFSTNILKILLSSFIMLVSIYVARDIQDISILDSFEKRLTNLLILFCIGSGVFLSAAFMLKIFDWSLIKPYIKKYKR